MDPFEVRMQCIDLLRKLNASQQSISKLVTFAIKHYPPCGEDIWDCIVEETQKGSINARINILYFLDSLCEACLKVKAQSRSERSRAANASGLYVQFVSRDLTKLVEWIVPEGRQGLPNLSSTKQILQNWRSKRYIDPQKIDDAFQFLDSRPQLTSSTSTSSTTTTAAPDASTSPSTSTTATTTTTAVEKEKPLSKHEVNKRIEQDRERHKRLRERRWVQPTSYNPASLHAPQLASFFPLAGPPYPTVPTGQSVSSGAQGGSGSGGTATGSAANVGTGAAWQQQEELPLDIEFENEWETTSDFNEDDEEAIKEEAQLAFPDSWGPDWRYG